MRLIGVFGIVFLLIVSVLWSCKKDYSHEGGWVPQKKCVNCNYLPACDSSTFTYIDSSTAGIDTSSSEVFILGDSIINGRKYTELTGMVQLGGNFYYNCDGQEYRLLVPLSAFGVDIDSIFQQLFLGLPIPPSMLQVPEVVHTTMLKANAPVNTTWTDVIYSLNVPFVANVYAGIDYKIMQKGISRTVYSNTFQNVIHVAAKLNVTTNLMAIPFDFAFDIYFAKDVGIVELHVFNNGQIQNISKLWEYEL